MSAKCREEDKTYLQNMYVKNKDILSKYLIMQKDKPSSQDIWYAYGRCTKEDLEILVSRKDNNALIFLNCKKNKNWRG